MALPPLVDVVATRTALHDVAEHILAAEQFAAIGTVRLHASGTGVSTAWFATPQGPMHRISIDGPDLVREVRTGDDLTSTRRPIGAGLDPDAVAVLDAWWALGDRVLSGLTAADGETLSDVVLWPEHFDIAVTLTAADGRGLNLGFSPGDEFSPVPYVYAGPWEPLAGEFWNASFGAYRTYAQIPDEDAALAFLTSARTVFAAP